MSRNRNSGGGRGGQPPAPSPATAAPAPATAPTPAPTPPANSPVGEPQDLRSFEEGGGELVPRKYLGWGTLVAALIVGLYMLPWGRWVEAVMSGTNKLNWWVAAAIVWLIAFGYLLYKKDSRVWVLIAITAFLWWADQPYKGRKPAEKPTKTDECGSWSKPIEVELPAYGETKWIEFPLGAKQFQFDSGDAGFSLLCLGGKTGWMDFAADDSSTLGSGCLTHTMKFRRYPETAKGRVVVKVSYLR